MCVCVVLCVSRVQNSFGVQYRDEFKPGGDVSQFYSDKFVGDYMELRVTTKEGENQSVGGFDRPFLLHLSRLVSVQFVLIINTTKCLGPKAQETGLQQGELGCRTNFHLLPYPHEREAHVN